MISDHLGIERFPSFGLGFRYYHLDTTSGRLGQLSSALVLALLLVPAGYPTWLAKHDGCVHRRGCLAVAPCCLSGMPR